ncbi:A-kinase anchor protein 11 isoform X8 [Balearica regulorum gibbericeps]|uniref:A-kinase anchor protein 11 isoform X8 n=1 Tax=Balearica regulorum gibbericeps TaxID=100784 RepID=UPI003F5EF9DE
MEMYARAQGNRMKPRISVKKSFGEGVLHSMKSLLHSRKELCNVSAEECLNREEQENFIEITFIGFAEEMGTVHLQELSAVSAELPDALKSLQLCKLKENEVIFLKDVKKTLAKPYVMKHQNQLPEVFCVMRLSPSFPRIKVDYIFTLLSKYTTGIRYAVEIKSSQKHQTETSHGEDDDTNQSVSSIEDDFVTAFEHLDEDEPSKIQSAGACSFTSQNHRDAASQTIPAQCLEAVDSKILVGSARRRSSARSSTLIDILGLKELSSVKNSVTTSISDPWIQRSFYKPYNPSDQGVNFLCKTLFSSSPAESSESDCSSPSPIIFLDEEGYQKSLKAKLQLPKIPVVKDGIEDSDSEVSEFFDSFDQFDELEQALENSCKVIRDPILGNPSQKRKTAREQLSSASITMNPQKFKFDRPTLPANVKKPTPRKPESPYSGIFDVPDSPRPVKTSGEESGGLFSPIRSSAFSPLGSCGSSECLCRINLSGDGTGQNHHDAIYNSYSAYADSVSFEILGSVFHSESSSEQMCAGNDSKHKGIALEGKKGRAADLKMKTGKEPDKQAKSKRKSLMIRDSIQKFAAELVEKSFGSAFKDLQKGVSSCTNALCHLAARLTSSVFQMAFYEIGRRRAISLKERAINGIANFLVSEAITGALKELRHVKKQIFTNTVARFAADLAEELVFEGIMEVCQFSYPSTPTAAQSSSFDYEDNVCFSESKDCWQEQKGHRFASKSPPPCSTVTFARHVLEDFPDAGSCSITYLNKPSKNRDTQKPSSESLTYRQADGFLHANSFSSVMFGSEDALQIEGKSSLKDGNTCVMPDTPPPTPLVPYQGSSERNLRKLSKKLKGELAKEFAPATPPSTPYNPSITGLSETERDSLENEEFMLKLMRSLSEEVESSEDEYHSEMPIEKDECSEKTIQYADCLASHIISIATEMAASHLDGKTNERETDTQVQLGMQNERCGYTAFINIPEETCNSLWNYAGDMAGKVIHEAKKIVRSRHCKLLRLKRVNCQVDCLYLRKGDKDYSSKERCSPAQDQWRGERDSSVLPLPQGSGVTGLTSKYPSCESVTDEYADHIIRVLKREGGNAELLMDQYASRLAYRSIKSGLQQAARKTKLRYNRKTFPGQTAQVNGKLELIKAANKDAQQAKSSIHRCEDQTYERSIDTHRTECAELLHFSESLARSITCDVRKKLKMSGACLPKSLTDSCLYKKTELDEVTGEVIKTRFSSTFVPFSPDHKLYHSTGSLNENGYSEGIIQAIEKYARKVADDTLEMSLESAVLHVAENRKNGDRLSYTEKLSPFSGTVCRCCSMKEHRYCIESTPHHLSAQESSIPVRHFLHSAVGGACQKSRVFQLDIPKIHVDVEQKTVFSDKGAAAAVEKAGELSYTSLTADSGIGQDGVSFAESLTTEIMTSAMTNIGQAVNISSVGREGFHSVESIVSQQMSLSIGDDSTGSWSNLSFEDEHPDESSSFLHLSDSSAVFSSSPGSNGNSSSWSSLGLEGDMYEENLSFPTSDSDGTEDKDEDSKDAVEGLEQIQKTLAIVNIDLEPNLVDPQLRAALQWLAASETEVSDLHFHDTAAREFVFLSRRLRERDWKVGDLLQAVLKYCEMIEKASGGEEALNKSLVGWLLENV